ncbi:MAG TPA: hypothetical protein VKE70_21335, partial [Candidatus Solibacter sp.]|nr:hypothetical protein [Candidatus Solibacter sp.]
SSKFDVDPNFGLGTVHTWNASLEHRVTRTTSVRVSYVGSATRGLPAALVLNRAVPNADATFFNRQARRPDPSISNWTRLANASDGNYAGLQLSVERRYAQGLQYQLSYTRSRARDLASDVGFGSGDIFYSMQFAADDIFNRTGNNGPRHNDLYGPTRFDYRNIFSYNFSYELPWRRKPGLVAAFASDWQLSGTAAYRDGYPVSIFCGANSGDCNLDGVTQDRPNVVDPSVIGTQFKDAPSNPSEANLVRISPTAFDQNVAPGARGNLGRNLFRTDSSFTMDVAIVRNLRLGDQHRVQLRLEVYDLFNNTYAGQPGLSLGSLGNFGRITGVSGNRSLQIAAKYYW